MVINAGVMTPMVDNGPSSRLGTATHEREVSVEPKSRSREVLDELVRRWKSWGVVSITAVTAYYLYTIQNQWTLDAITFSLLSGGFLVYTLVTLRSDIK